MAMVRLLRRLCADVDQMLVAAAPVPRAMSLPSPLAPTTTATGPRPRGFSLARYQDADMSELYGGTCLSCRKGTLHCQICHTRTCSFLCVPLDSSVIAGTACISSYYIPCPHGRGSPASCEHPRGHFLALGH